MFQASVFRVWGLGFRGEGRESDLLAAGEGREDARDARQSRALLP